MADDYWMKRRAEELNQEENSPPDKPSGVLDPLFIEQEIEIKLKQLTKARSVVFDAAAEKAKAISTYAKKATIAEIKLKNGLIDKFEDIEIGKVIASGARKIAEGICWRELHDKEEKEGIYKACIVNIEAIQAELNGLQSLLKRYK